MNTFKRAISMLFLALFAMVLSACMIESGDVVSGDNAGAANDINTYISEGESADGLILYPFSGNIHDPFFFRLYYEFVWTDERDRAWEEDIVQFATTMLRHPTLRGYGLISTEEALRRDMFEDDTQRTPLAGFNLAFTHADFYINKELEYRLIDMVNELIFDVPALSDIEIKFRLSEIIAILGDAHSNIELPLFETIYPLGLVSLYDGFYVTAIPKVFEHVLYSRLIRINGFYVDDIVERFAEIIPHENNYRLRALSRLHLRGSDILSFTGVTGDMSPTTFTFESISGEMLEISLSPTSTPNEIDMIVHQFDGEENLTHRNPGEDFWGHRFPEKSVVYLRNRSLVESSLHLAQVLNNLDINDRLETLVIDLRQNVGGFLPSAMTNFADDMISGRISTVYVIIDSGSYSAPIIFASLLRSTFENVYIVGEPAPQPANFFVSQRATLRHSGVGFNVSEFFRETSQDERHIYALVPDIFIPLTIGDIVNYRDPVMEFILTK